MKLTIEEQGRKVTIETPFNGLTASAVVEKLFRPAMLGHGYLDETMEKVLGPVDYEALK